MAPFILKHSVRIHDSLYCYVFFGHEVGPVYSAFTKVFSEESRVLVADIGGGTFVDTIVQIF